MLKIFRYLKKSWLGIIVVLVCLFVQAMCDLSLPDYTSDIVNVGIQQGGIKDSVPEAIRKTEFERIQLFLNQEESNKFFNNYDLVNKSSASESQKTDFPKVEEEEVYFLKNDISDDDREELNNILGKPMLLVSSFESDGDEVKKMKENMKLPENVDVFSVFNAMPKEQFSQIKDKMLEQFKEMPDSIVTQASTTYIKQEYTNLGIDTDSRQKTYILISGAKMIGVSFLSILAAIVVGFVASKIAARVSQELRSKVFTKVMSFSNEEMDKFSTASLITRNTNDIQQVQMVIVLMLKMVLYAPIIGIGAIIKVINTDVSMTWIIALAVVIILAIVGTLFMFTMPKFKILQTLIDKLNLVTREILTGIPVIRAFSTQKHEEERFDEANTILTKVTLFINRVMSGMMPLMMFVMNGVSLLIVWVGAKAIDDGIMQVGDMMAFMQYAMQIIMAFLMLTMMSIMLPRAAVSLDRIDEVLNTKLRVKDPENPVEFTKDNNSVIEFKNVSFKYPDADENVLEDITFTAKSGQTTAFIGGTGSGKTTLINLIPRFFDVTEGEVLINGIDIRKVTQHALREKIGYVPQKGVLFSGTIESNIKYGNEEASIEEVKKAAEIAQSTEFIDIKPKTYQEEISQGGTNVSGGQKQRLSIARAIAKKPSIYIFDDSFSALDFKTDAKLRKALHEETGDSTVLIVAQRISTILHADQIIVLDEGKIVGKGTHKELMDNCEVYKQIALSQLSKEELANE